MVLYQILKILTSSQMFFPHLMCVAMEEEPNFYMSSEQTLVVVQMVSIFANIW